MLSESGASAVNRYDNPEEDCPVCLEPLPPFWDTERLGMFICCGKGACRDCYQKRTAYLDRARAEGSFGKAEEQLQNCCPCCRSQIPNAASSATLLPNKFDQGSLQLRLYPMMGLCYLGSEQGVDQNTEKGLEILMLGAEKGDPCCQYSLGMVYCQGEGGLPNDTAKARRWLLAATEQGHAVAESQLANILREEGDDAEYLRLLRGSASKGYGPACFDLGLALFHGEHGVQQSTEQAIRVVTPAAERGHAESMALLGSMMCISNSASTFLPPWDNPNFTKGMHWARRAATTGDGTAISKLEGLEKWAGAVCFRCCKKAPPEKAFLHCSRCRAAWYCSKDCQVQHWKAGKGGHKHFCIKWE